MDWPRLTMATGPGDVTDRTLRDQARQVTYHYDPRFIELFARTTDLAKEVFRTGNDVVIMQGEVVLGMEAAIASLISPGDRVLALSSGVYGHSFRTLCERVGAETIPLDVPPNEAVDPEDVRVALRRHPNVRFLTVVHSEMPSGTLNPVEHICPIAREFGVISIVDASAGVGGELFRTDDWAVDVAIGGPQKCLGGVPGLSLLSVSRAAWDAMERRTPPLRDSYLSVLDWRETWIRRRRFPYTISVSLVYALESVLTQALEEGLDRRVARHTAVGRACRAGVRALGFELWPARDRIMATAITVIRVPEGFPEAEVRREMRERYGVMVAGGLGEFAGKQIRLGHMAVGAHPTHLAAQLAVFERSLANLGQRVSLGAAVGAAMATLGDWQ
ncbi:MAG: pyridoxal-phosphate-dependent aminotransferase family protein [Armatimonadota bacterium]